jgi:hypothetical protein
MNTNNEASPDDPSVGVIFGSEETLPLREVAEYMTQLMTFFKNRSERIDYGIDNRTDNRTGNRTDNENDDYATGYDYDVGNNNNIDDESSLNVLNVGHNIAMNKKKIDNDNNDKNENNMKNSNSNSSNNRPLGSNIISDDNRYETQGSTFDGQSLSRMQSFDTMASRVSAPNLMSMDIHKTGMYY